MLSPSSEVLKYSPFYQRDCYVDSSECARRLRSRAHLKTSVRTSCQNRHRPNSRPTSKVVCPFVSHWHQGLRYSHVVYWWVCDACRSRTMIYCHAHRLPSQSAPLRHWRWHKWRPPRGSLQVIWHFETDYRTNVRWVVSGFNRPLTDKHDVREDTFLPDFWAIPTVPTKLVLTLMRSHLMAFTQSDQCIRRLTAQLPLLWCKTWYAGTEDGRRKAGY